MTSRESNDRRLRPRADRQRLDGNWARRRFTCRTAASIGRAVAVLWEAIANCGDSAGTVAGHRRFAGRSAVHPLSTALACLAAIRPTILTCLSTMDLRPCMSKPADALIPPRRAVSVSGRVASKCCSPGVGGRTAVGTDRRVVTLVRPCVGCGNASDRPSNGALVAFRY